MFWCRWHDDGLLALHRRLGIASNGYAPFAAPDFVHWNVSIAADPTLSDIAAATNRTNWQVVLRWELQKGWMVNPRSTFSLALFNRAPNPTPNPTPNPARAEFLCWYWVSACGTAYNPIQQYCATSRSSRQKPRAPCAEPRGGCGGLPTADDRADGCDRPDTPNPTRGTGPQGLPRPAPHPLSGEVAGFPRLNQQTV